MRRFQGITLVIAMILAAASGCWSASDREVVVYAALDREFSEPVLEQFAATSGVSVLDKYDVESTKTVGLVTEIIQERNRPRCDVFWNNEILHTLRLKKLGLLEVYRSPQAEPFPRNYRSEDDDWFGLAARARVLIVNKDLVPPDALPTSIHDLANPRWRGQVGIAKPLFGTTATHAAVLFSAWGTDRATDFFRSVEENAEVLSGNKQVAAAVGRGQLAFGITDTDDAIIEVDNGMPVEIIFPDQGEDASGALFIPNTICIIKGSRNQDNAKKLIDFLLSPTVESQLAQGHSAQVPVNPQVSAASRALPVQSVKWMDVDFEAAAEHWNEASGILRGIFAAAD